ncbi:hypothetical protein [Streptomyces sp. NPDC091212]|uniref:DUF7169 domain-containing protein n=1 Tax=Streptomyces sp. NPDC091212 TaxID=3155191 RepID=UPI00343E8EBF
MALLSSLDSELSEVRRLLDIYDDAVTMPGRRPDVDADGTGRRASSGPSRPTEIAALDEARDALLSELHTGARQVAYAVAYVRGVAASMDRALLRWEGEDEVLDHRGMTP